MLLVLDALAHRVSVDDTQRARVPVLFTAHGWDPTTCSVQDWPSSRLAADYPLLQHRSGQEEAKALVDDGKIALILDGLDEMDEAARPAALQALSDAPFRVVVLSRSDEMVQATRETSPGGASPDRLPLPPASWPACSRPDSFGGLTGALAFGSTSGLDEGLGFALMGFGFGLPLGLVYGRAGREPKRLKNWRAINLRRVLTAGLAYGIGMGLAGSLVAFVMVVVAFLSPDTNARVFGLMVGLMMGLMFGFPFGLAVGLTLGLAIGIGGMFAFALRDLVASSVALPVLMIVWIGVGSGSPPGSCTASRSRRWPHAFPR